MTSNMDASTWLKRFAEKLGAEAPAAQETEQLLELAGVAAHTSERIAAPIACYLAGRVGIPPEKALELAKTVAPEA